VFGKSSIMRTTFWLDHEALNYWLGISKMVESGRVD
jgi:hypothetical protein